MQVYLKCEWHDRIDRIQVTNSFNGDVIDTIPRGMVFDVDVALRALEDGARSRRNIPSAERCRILRSAADQLRERADEFTITRR